MEPTQRGLIRTRSGCETCRIRHVKCDETRPNCNRCQKTGWKCDGYNRTPRNAPLRNRHLEKRPVPRILPALPRFDNPRQRDFFSFFVSGVSTAATIYFGTNFWAYRVLQLGLSEPSIRYAICSLGALYRMSTAPSCTNSGFTTADLRNYALQQYNHSVRCTRKLLAGSDASENKMLKGLVACALFVSYESFTGNHHISQMHLKSGCQIISREGRKPGLSKIPRDIIQIFKRLDLQATSFTHSRVPHTDHIVDKPLELIPSLSPGLFSLEDSVDVVMDLSRWLFRRAAYLPSCPISLSDLKSANNTLLLWNIEILRFLNAPPISPKAQAEQPTTLVQIYQILITIITATGVLNQETLHDAHLNKYKQVLALAEGITSSHYFCFDIGIIFPLFWVAIKCRDWCTRRRALSILGSMHHQEGAWTSITAVRVAEFVFTIEEEGLPEGAPQHQIPELKRVHLVHTVADDERGEICLSCLLRSSVDGQSWYTREGRFSYKGELLPVQ